MALEGIVVYNGSMKPQDLQNAPKIFCENIRIGYSPEFFILGLSSGAQATIYTLTPEHAKRLLQYLSHEIMQYEKQNGKIAATWNPNIVSPVQGVYPPSEQS